MSESKIKFREALGRYVQVLQDQGVRRVPLDRKAREVLRGMKAAVKPEAKAAAARATPAPAPVAATATPPPTPAPAMASVSPAPALEKVDSAASRTQAVHVSAAGSKQDRLDRLAAQAREALKDQPGDTFRNNFVFGEGDPDAAILFVGEAPGAEEDRLGRPFVGRAGLLLNKMIEAMGLKREQVYIANILKFRPSMPAGAPGNRKPTPEEMEVCLPTSWARSRSSPRRRSSPLGATLGRGAARRVAPHQPPAREVRRFPGHARSCPPSTLPTSCTTRATRRSARYGKTSCRS